MAVEWTDTAWGEIVTLEYGGLAKEDYSSDGPYAAFGSNGPVGRTKFAEWDGPGVIVGRKGSLGVQYSKEPFGVIGTAFFLVPKIPMDMRWAYYHLSTVNIGGMDSGSAIPSTSRDAFYLLPVKLPSLPEQRGIAHNLGTLDDKIELNRRMSETLDAIARALFKSWFVDFDPVRAKAEGRDPGLPKPLSDLFPDACEDSEFGEIPSGWQSVPLTKIATYQNGAACQKFAAADDEPSIPVIKIRELNQGVSDQSDRARLDVPEKHKCDDGDVLFSWSGTLVCKVWTGGEGFVNQHLFKVSSNTFPRWFYLWWTKHYLELFQGIAADKATTMGHIKRDDLERASVLVPGKELLKWMSNVMEPIVERGVRCDLESRTLAELRDTLLPQLITGAVRVPQQMLGGAER